MHENKIKQYWRIVSVTHRTNNLLYKIGQTFRNYQRTRKQDQTNKFYILKKKNRISTEMDKTRAKSLIKETLVSENFLELTKISNLQIQRKKF